jgi:dTMP kinase
MFITFEGLERAGKTTAIKAIEKYLQDNKIEKHFVITREPGGTGIKEAEIIRSFVLSPEYNIDPMSEALLYLVSRKIHLTQKIEPALQEGKIVICDRFIDSSTAYQGFGRELGFEKIQKLNDIVTNNMKPDITFFIKITPQTS